MHSQQDNFISHLKKKLIMYHFVICKFVKSRSGKRLQTKSLLFDFGIGSQNLTYTVISIMIVMQTWSIKCKPFL